MKLKQYPHLTEKFPAIDGIAKEGEGKIQSQEAIRRDVEEILKLPDAEFNTWHKEKMGHAQSLYTIVSGIGDVPNLGYGSEEYTMKTGSTTLHSLTQTLEQTIDFLEKIALVRANRKKE